MDNKKRFVAIIIALVLVVILVITGTVWYYETHQAKFSPPTNEGSSTSIALISQKEGCSLLSSSSTVLLSTVSDYTSEDMRGGMMCEFIINPKLPVFNFHFMGEPDNTLGDIEITEGTSTNIIQTIQNTTDYDATFRDPKNTLTIVDTNFDGYGDLSILNNCGGTGNCAYDFYLYDPITSQFIYNSFLSNLGTPSFNDVKKQVVTSWNTSAADHENDTYQYQNGQYVLVEKQVSTWNRNDTSTSDGTITLQTFKFKNGAMELINSTTTPFDDTN
jgi:hypothetical protein